MLTGNEARQRAIDSLSKLPPFSPILSRLLASLAGEDVSFSALGDLIEKDTVVAANVLKLVNSAAYARRAEVNSVRRALSVLGIEKVRNTVLAMSISRMMNQARPPAGWSMERFNKHAAAVAMLGDLLAQRVPTEYAEGAFIAGLLHDIGRLLIAIGLPKEYAEISRLYAGTSSSWFNCEQQVLGFDHAGLSADAIHAWKLPDPIRDAIQRHHEPPALVPGAPVPLARVLHSANIFVDAFGCAIELEPKAEMEALAAISALGIPPDAQETLLEQFQLEHAAIAHFYH
jgi:HD-like signal output (HDOD) protein